MKHVNTPTLNPRSGVLELAQVLIAVNESEVILDHLDAACNELSLNDDWLKISPWGDFSNKVGLQRIRSQDGEAMVKAFNSLRGKLERSFRGVPIFVGHPDFLPDKYPDKRRYGRIDDLQVREDGLYAKVSLNDLGKEAVDEGHYLFCSPTWELKREGNVVRPVRLISVGLTNTPNIPGEPWAKNEEPPTEGNTMPQWLTNLLMGAGLIQADASEQQAEAAVNELLQTRNLLIALNGIGDNIRAALEKHNQDAGEGNQVTMAQLASAMGIDEATLQQILDGEITDPPTERIEAAATLLGVPSEALMATEANEDEEKKKDQPPAPPAPATNEAELQRQLDQEREARVNRELDIAVNEGRILEADRVAWKARLKQDFTVGLNELTQRQPVLPTQPRFNGARKDEAGSSNKLTAINEAVRDYAKEHNLNLSVNKDYNAAFSAVKAAKPALFS